MVPRPSRQLSQTASPARSAPAVPAAALVPGTTRAAGRSYGNARPAPPFTSSQEHAASTARPWPSVKQSTVLPTALAARTPSAIRPWTSQRIDPQ